MRPDECVSNQPQMKGWLNFLGGIVSNNTKKGEPSSA
jgi:hypothetical protein